MSRNTEFNFISTDTEEIVSKMINKYEEMTNTTVQPASPERLMISWVASVIIQERILNNFTGNQNIPSRATGENLDALGSLIYDEKRPKAQAAKTTVRCYISEVLTENVLISKGTRITDVAKTLIWETTADAHIKTGEIFIDVMVQCQTPGVIGNGFVAGQINTIVDTYDYFDHCENITQSDGGADASSDDEYYELMRASQDAYSNAGSEGGYIFFAKQVSNEIKDVVANSPSPGTVKIYTLMEDGMIAGTEIKNAILVACTDKYVRPLTDYVSTADPEIVNYNISLTYFISSGSPTSVSDIQASVDNAVVEYQRWQIEKFGRDINPSYLTKLLMETGIKRVEIIEPTFIALRNGSDNAIPQIAQIGTVTVLNGGYEDE